MICGMHRHGSADGTTTDAWSAAALGGGFVGERAEDGAST